MRTNILSHCHVRDSQSSLCNEESSFVRGALLTKGPDSSSHIEDEVDDQEDEAEDGRDCEECKERVEERSNTQAHEAWMV